MITCCNLVWGEGYNAHGTAGRHASRVQTHVDQDTQVSDWPHTQLCAGDRKFDTPTDEYKCVRFPS
jgi:hypothetical protein